jgi:two-component sensor histidine kinase
MSISELQPDDRSRHAEMDRSHSRESNHRIANNLTLVSALLRLQANAIAKNGEPLSAQTAAGTLIEAATRIENVGRLHRLLSGEHDDAVAGPYLADVCAGIMGSLAHTDEITFDDKSGGARLAPERLNAIGLFLTEALTNAFKHAHPAGAPGVIRVKFGRNGHDLELESHDDGVGLPEGFDPAKDGGLGFRIMRSLAAQIGGTLSFPRRQFGLCIRLRAPVAVAVRCVNVS